MKLTRWMVVLVASGFFMAMSAQAEIATVEVQVVDQIYGTVLLEGSAPWDVNAPIVLADLPAGLNVTVSVRCLDAVGALLFTGEMTDIPILPLDPNPVGFILLYPQPEGIYVVVDGFLGLGLMELTPVDPGEIEVVLDIKPGSTENPVNVGSRGVLPVVILGSAGLDVGTIDPASVVLAGVAPVRYSVADVGAVDRSPSPDGFNDLVLHFRTEDVVAALGVVADRAVIALELTGSLVDGTPIVGTDQITVLVKGKKQKSK